MMRDRHTWKIYKLILINSKSLIKYSIIERWNDYLFGGKHDCIGSPMLAQSAVSISYTVTVKL